MRRLIQRLFPLVLLLPVACVVYWRFLNGDAVLLYKDIGSDSLNIYYPGFVHLADYIRTEGYPGWSFFVGMGQDLSHLAGYVLWNPVIWFGRRSLSHLLIY